PHLVTILGPAGVGKTRIGQEFAHIGEEGGGHTVRGRSLPYRESSAYGAFAGQVRLMCDIFASDSSDVAAVKLRATLKTLLPDAQAIDVADHLGLIPGLDPDSAVADRETLFFSVRCFLEAVTGAHAERAADIAAVVGGNPLFIVQFSATFAESASGVGETLPTTVKGIVAARLDALPPQERSVLLDAAVVGKVFWRGALERMASEPNGLGDALAALERRDLIRRETVSIIDRDH